jgi:Rrf2 family protein
MSRLFTLSEAASIALHSMVLIARAEKGINVIRVSELTNTSKHHVAKVMQRLVKEGFVTSQRGPNGGFMLNVKPTELTLLDIYEAIEGKIQPATCLMENSVCPLDKCLMNNVTHRLTNEFMDYLRSQTLKDFV